MNLLDFSKLAPKPRRRYRLRAVVLDRFDLVDAPANPFAVVALVKRAEPVTVEPEPAPERPARPDHLDPVNRAFGNAEMVNIRRRRWSRIDALEREMSHKAARLLLEAGAEPIADPQLMAVVNDGTHIGLDLRDGCTGPVRKYRWPLAGWTDQRAISYAVFKRYGLDATADDARTHVQGLAASATMLADIAAEFDALAELIKRMGGTPRPDED